MPLKNPEARKAYHKLWCELNREKCRTYQRVWKAGRTVAQLNDDRDRAEAKRKQSIQNETADERSRRVAKARSRPCREPGYVKSYLKSISEERVAYRKKYRENNKDKMNHRERSRRATQKVVDPERARRIRRNAELKRTAGITLVEFENRLALQGGVCAICGQASKSSLHLDHDHTTGVLRDILCRHCNIGLGNFRDSIVNLRLAIAYLEKHYARSAA